MHRPRVRPRPATRGASLAVALSLALAPVALGGCSSGSGSTGTAATAGTSSSASSASSASSGSSGSSGSPSSSGPSSEASSSTTSSASPTSTGEVDAPSPSDLLAKAKAAVEQAKSSHVSGTVKDSGKPVTVDVAGTSDGTSAQGSVKTAEATIEFILVGGQTYIRGDQKFWATAGAPAARAAELASSKKWVKASAAEAKSFTQLANPKALLGELLGTDTNSLTQKVDATTVDGAPCWGLRDRIGSDDAELDVLKSSYLPVRLAIGKGQSLTFGDWDSVPTPTAPAASQIITG
ncbi:hypothetical protein [Lapillicoccus jejuensis]|uniref:Lipoprotein n=1 Tax=Lapillicoccus jejuensis TaxID=402171 RepID=A0A542E1M5_9MICO|nr:hypothetical protein [Lapillicoccus jejuensis]TQJ09242.1 hypothetical protein FB458_2352 [Lapillicoccus jejuensis]